MIADLLRLFPAVIAPAIVDRLRRRWPSIDGLIVWPVVVVVAVVLALLGAVAGTAELTRAGLLGAAREGVALGLAAIGVHFLATGRRALGSAEAPPPPPEAP